MVKPPTIEQLTKDTDTIEAMETAKKANIKDPHQLNSLCRHRAQDVARIPKMFENRTMVTATKKVNPEYGQITDKMTSQLPHLHVEPTANYFVEIHDELRTNYRYLNEFDDDLNEINRELISQDNDE